MEKKSPNPGVKATFRFGSTAGHKTFGCQWWFGRSTPHKLLLSVDKNVARIPKRFHTGKPPLATSRKKKINIEK